MRWFLLAFYIVVSCGKSTYKETVRTTETQPAPLPGPPAPAPIPPIPPIPSPPGSSYSEVSAILSRSCLGSNCHSTPGARGVNLDSESGFKASFNRVLSEVKSGGMPIGGRQRLSAQEISVLENYGGSSGGGGTGGGGTGDDDDDDDDDGDDDD